MKLYNTMTRQKEEFVPMEEGKVKMYVCGPTVYDYIHIGNARPYVVFDTVRRYLEYKGYEVTYVQNFTDVDDKIINRANKEGKTMAEISNKYIEEAFRDADGLNVKRATVHPRVTEEMDGIIAMVQTLIDKGFAYEDHGTVYYDTKKFPEYGKLSRKNLDELIARAEKLRRKYKGNHVSIHILTNARSGNCSQDCAYCAQSCRSKADIDKYKWVADEKLYADNDFVNEHHLSRHCIGLSGMKFTDAEIEELAEKIRKMKEHGTHLCCSIGFLTEKQALMLKEAGLDRINHNLNSSRAYYHNICSTHTFEQRVANIKMLQGLGFEICSGGIIGMGESKEDVVDMLLELREIRPEALPINFLLPIPGTPLEHADMSALTTAYCMKVLCLARLLVPQSDIRCAAGREIYFKGEEKNLLRVVDSIFASGYLTAGGQGIKDTIQAIEDAGFTYEIESA